MRPAAARIGPLEAVAHRIILSQGWVRLAIAVAAGACGALAMPPYGLFPALGQIDAASLRSVFFRGSA